MLRFLKKGFRFLVGAWRFGQRFENWLNRTVDFIREERRAPRGLPWARRLWALWNGFHSIRLVQYGLTRENVADFLPDRFYASLHPINGRFSALIDDKFQLQFTLKDFPEYLPKTYFLVRDGMLFGLADGLRPCQAHEPGPLLDLLHKQHRLVLKPEHGSRGKGVRSVELDSGTWRLDGRTSNESEVVEVFRELRMHLVCEYVEQNEYARLLYPHTTNTIRFVTLRDEDTLQPFLLTAFHRVGTSVSQPVDNVAAGALFAPIDFATGALGRFSRQPVTRTLEWFTHHPETNQLLAGVVIPHWQDLTRRILDVSRHLSFLTWMGYDVVVTEDGLKILEINSLPALSYQMFRPYMTVPPVADFFTRRIPQLRRHL